MSTDCVLSSGKPGWKGYHYSYYKGKKDRAHRNAYRQAKGEIPEGMLVRHSCDNPACVNPEHLLLGTPIDNSADMKSRQRQSFGMRRSQAKLTDETATQVMATLLLGESQRSVAKTFGVSSGTVQRVWEGKSWKHLGLLKRS